MKTEKGIRKVLLAFTVFFIIVSCAIYITSGEAIKAIPAIVLELFAARLALEIILRVKSFRQYRFLVTHYEELNEAHRFRYKACFMDNKQKEIKQMTSNIEKAGADLITYGNLLLTFDKYLSQKQKVKVKEIMEQIEHLITTFQPEMEPYD